MNEILSLFLDQYCTSKFMFLNLYCISELAVSRQEYYLISRDSQDLQHVCDGAADARGRVDQGEVQGGQGRDRLPLLQTPLQNHLHPPLHRLSPGHL